MKCNQKAITCISWGCKWTWGGNNRKEPKNEIGAVFFACYMKSIVPILNSSHKPYEQNPQIKTFSADCRKIAAVYSHNSIGIERKENINKH